MISIFKKVQKTDLPYNLSPREKEVLGHLVIGKPIKAMAADLNIAPDTVKKHLGHIYDKLEVPGGREAMRKAFLEGLVDFG